MKASLERLVLEARALTHLRDSAAARHCAAVEAARTPKFTRSVHGAAKATAAFALKLLMQAQEDFRDPAARSALIDAIGSAAGALRHEPDRAAPAPCYYWMEQQSREDRVT